jgi:hypothetical protein
METEGGAVSAIVVESPETLTSVSHDIEYSPVTQILEDLAAGTPSLVQSWITDAIRARQIQVFSNSIKILDGELGSLIGATAVRGEFLVRGFTGLSGALGKLTTQEMMEQYGYDP